MGKTLYVTDLDGTLLNQKSRISERSLSILNSMMEKGLNFTYATARSILSARTVTEGLQVKLPVITMNGTYIVDPVTREAVDSTEFSAEVQRKIMEIIERHEISPFIFAYIDGVERVSWMKGTENEGMQYYLSNRPGDPRMRPITSKEELYQGEIFHYVCIGSKEELTPFYEEILSQGICQVILQQEIYREEYWCEIMPIEATKANAIRRLKKMLGCDKAVVFGDAPNDISMFESADECYAVANAVPALKEIATDVILSNEEDGVAEWLSCHAELP